MSSLSADDLGSTGQCITAADSPSLSRTDCHYHQPVYWDPLPTVRASASLRNLGWDDGRLLDPAEDYLRGMWEHRDWRNVPGPFYGAQTDNCWAGRPIAPDHIVYEDGYGGELVFRQPQNAWQTQLVLSAAWTDPFLSYACDGDDHWNLELIRTWWADRARLRTWIDAVDSKWSISQDAQTRDAAKGLRDFRSYLDNGLETYLREYGFWLENRRPARPEETLPDLGD